MTDISGINAAYLREKYKQWLIENDAEPMTVVECHCYNQGVDDALAAVRERVKAPVSDADRQKALENFDALIRAIEEVHGAVPEHHKTAIAIIRAALQQPDVPAKVREALFLCGSVLNTLQKTNVDKVIDWGSGRGDLFISAWNAHQEATAMLDAQPVKTVCEFCGGAGYGDPARTPQGDIEEQPCPKCNGSGTQKGTAS